MGRSNHWGFRRSKVSKLPRRSRLPRVELLETRQLLTTFLVTNTQDHGAGSLRYAINQANVDPIGNGRDFIEPSGVIGPIFLGSGLPALTRPDVTLEDLSVFGTGTHATSGTGSSNNGAPSLSTANGLSVAGSSDVVGGYGSIGFGGGQGIYVSAGAVTITNSEINNNGQGGVVFGSKANGGTINVNVVSGNGTNGITLESSNNLVTGNTVGLNAAGNAADPNGQAGIVISNGADNTIGGTSAGQGNIVSGNSSDGIAALGGGATGNLIEGNYVGTDATGTFAIGNGSPGVIMFIGASDNTIGPGNVISGNDSQGIQLSTSDNLIVGNLIGTDKTGAVAIANTQGGIEISTPGSGNTIGGTSAGDANIISGNDSVGIVFIGSGTTLNVVEGNYIGTNTTGATGLGNTGGGVDIAATGSGGPSDNNIGGSSSAYGNTISGNGGAGIYVFGSAISGNLIAANTISDNKGDGVQISASSAGGPDGNTIGGASAGYANIITSNDGAGILVLGSGISGNLVAGNTISDNTGDGVDIIASTSGGPTGNAIGGASAGYANIITGNGTGIYGGDGILVLGGAISGNLIAGNTISDNTLDGVEILAGSASNPGGPTGNFIGGSSSAFGNDITSNGGSGILVFGSAISGNLIAANTISDNTGDGVDIYAGTSGGGPTGNTIGGTSAGYANIITSNSGNGIYISGSGATGNLVAGNFIGTDSGDDIGLGNSDSGVRIDNGASGNTISSNVITSNSGNGIYISGSGATDNLAAGNFIGTDSGDDIGLGNSVSGVRIDDGASGNTISGNVIASNAFDGVTIDGDGTSDNLVADNYLGTDSAGDTGLGNDDSGVAVFGGASSNTISGNTISYNGANKYGNYGGVDISGANDNVVAGNTISDNVYDGVDIFGGAVGNTIGGTQPADANTIASNTWGGVDISDSDTSDNVVDGNFIGTNSSDAPGLGNGLVGVTIFGGATDNTIGGATTIAPDGFHSDVIRFSYANTIVSNGAGGVDIEDSGTTGNVVEGNFIGTDASSDTGLGNLANGVEILGGASDNAIGGASSGAGNVVSGNRGAGVDIIGSTTSGNEVEGNLIGTKSGGTSALKNGYWGVEINGAPDNTVGGTTSTARNVISGNNEGGVAIYSGGANDDVIEGNYIGTDVSGTLALSNGYSGIFVGAGSDFSDGTSGSASDATIGGTASGAGNVISGNQQLGVWITGAGATGNVVQGNKIGTDYTGTQSLPNEQDGVLIDAGASGNMIGGTVSGAANIIAFNGGNGVLVGDDVHDAALENAILENSIFSNTDLGIDIDNSAPQAAPVLGIALSSASQTSITGTVTGADNTTLRVEFFSNPAGTGQGKTFIGFLNVTTNGSGVGSFTFTPASVVATGLNITATATDPHGNTSEFSSPDTVQAAPVNVNADLSVTAGGFIYNRTTRQFTQTLTIKNTSGAPIPGPIELELVNLKNATLVNSSGTYQGNPYITILSSGSLGIGQSITFTLYFSDPTLAQISYTSEFLAGPIPPPPPPA
jgi:parallel beta-helix repeat protein